LQIDACQIDALQIDAYQYWCVRLSVGRARAGLGKSANRASMSGCVY